MSARPFSGNLHRALNRKVHRLRRLLSHEDDLTEELSRIVCCLLNLALRFIRRHDSPPSPYWMQCKMYDLLTLSEKALDRRRKYFIDSYRLRSEEFEDTDMSAIETNDIADLSKFKQESTTANKLMTKYNHLLDISYDNGPENLDDDYPYQDLDDFSSHISRSTNILKDHSLSVFDTRFSSLEFEQNLEDIEKNLLQSNAITEHETLSSIKEGLISNDISISDDVVQNTFDKETKCKDSISEEDGMRFLRKRKRDSKAIRKVKNAGKYGRRTQSRFIRNVVKGNRVTDKDLNYFIVEGNACNSKRLCVITKKIWEDRKKSQMCIAKPIPDCLIELCKKYDTSAVEFNDEVIQNVGKDVKTVLETIDYQVAATEESYHIDIVMEDMEETIALRRSIGTDACDAEVDDEVSSEKCLGESSNFYNKNNHFVTSPSSQTDFLFDINEPSTSKGIRHTNMDVQCGSNTAMNILFDIPEHNVPIGESFTDLNGNLDIPVIGISANNISKCISPTLMCKGIKITDDTSSVLPSKNISSFTNVNAKSIGLDFGTSMNDDNESSKVIIPRTISKGISIKDSEFNIKHKVKNTVKIDDIVCDQNDNCPDSKLLTVASSCVKIKDSSFDLCPSTESLSKSPCSFDKSSNAALVEDISSSIKRIRPKLSCGTMQMHSYREKHTSEDVVYQGNWQSRQTKTKNISRTKQITCVVSKTKESLSNFNKNKVKPGDKVSHRKSLHKLQYMGSKDMKNLRKSNNQEPRKIDDSQKNNTISLSKSLYRTRKSIHKLSRVATSSVQYNPGKIMNNNQPNKTLPTTKNFLKINKQCYKTKIALKTVLDKNKPIQIRHKISKKLLIEKKGEDTLHVIKSKKYDIKKELLKPTYERLQHNVSYVVLRNESDNNKYNGSKLSCSKDYNIRKENYSVRKTFNSPSTSSSCSSPNSVATVRTVSKSNLLRTMSKSTSWNNSPSQSASLTKLSSDVDKKGSTSPSVNRIIKFDNTKRPTVNKDIIGAISKDRSHVKSLSKASFDKSKNVFMTKLTAHNITTYMLSKSEQYPSSSDDNNIKQNQNKHKSKEVPRTLQLKITENNLGLPCSEILVHENDCVNDSNDQANSNDIDAISESMTVNQVDSKKDYENVVCTKSSEHVNFIRDMIEHQVNSVISELPIKLKGRSGVIKLNWAESINISNNNSTNLSQYNSSIYSKRLPVNENMIITSSIKNSNCGLSWPQQHSYKSITSLNKKSEYFLADTDFRNHERNISNADNYTSVHDIFERKEQLTVKNPNSLLAVQAFSGYSVNTEQTVGDRPDCVNIVDSETGSMAVDVSRRIASEELYISGRSSESYQSCVIDDDAVIPNWLYEMIAEQESQEEESTPSLGTLPLAEPLFDRNGNVIESTLGAGAGAGDGCGVHSVYSQDSSGRGTSLSSSNTNISSGPLSEVLIVDPQAYNGQYQLLRDNTDSSNTLPIDQDMASTSRFREGRNGGLGSPNSRSRDEPLMRNTVMATSDVDADVSSLEADLPDLSDS